MQTEPSEPIGPVRWTLVALIVLAAAVALVLVPDTTPTADPVAAPTDAMLQVSPGGQVELASLPQDQQVLYEAAAADPDAFTQVACYCGCESFLDHRHLLDCFVRPDGAWERHATGCAVCLAEAAQVVEMREAQVPISEISRRIDADFGAITASTQG